VEYFEQNILRKVEELTLHLIEQQKEITQLKVRTSETEAIKKRLSVLEEIVKNKK
jgi:hypothetical protein